MNQNTRTIASKQTAQLLFWLVPIPVLSALRLAGDEWPVEAYVFYTTIGATFSMPGFAVVLHFTPPVSRTSSTRLYCMSAMLGVVCLALSTICVTQLASIDLYALTPFVPPTIATVVSCATLSLACAIGILERAPSTPHGT